MAVTYVGRCQHCWGWYNVPAYYVVEFHSPVFYHSPECAYSAGQKPLTASTYPLAFPDGKWPD